jgi:hypothetical protein
MTSLQQEIFLIILSLIVIPTLAWLVAKILTNEKDIIKIKADVAKIGERNNEHREWLLELSKTAQRTDRNIVAIARELNVKDLETE